MTQKKQRGKRGRQEEQSQVASIQDKPTLHDVMIQLRQISAGSQTIPTLTTQVQNHEYRLFFWGDMHRRHKTALAVSASMAASDESHQAIILAGGWQSADAARLQEKRCLT
eukprot:944693-Amphidinium_carterae.2